MQVKTHNDKHKMQTSKYKVQNTTQSAKHNTNCKIITQNAQQSTQNDDHNIQKYETRLKLMQMQVLTAAASDWSYQLRHSSPVEGTAMSPM